MISFKQFVAESAALKKYTSSDDYSYYKGDIAREFDDLKKKYPHSGGKLYRGINFSTPKAYLDFRRAIKSGYVTTESISSWTHDASTASQFAQSPQVFQVTSFVLAGYDPNERINGFIGVVLVTDVPSGVGIDVNKSPFAKESEVILPAGRYKVVDMIVEKKWKHIVSKLDINQEVVAIINTKKEVDNELMRQLFRYKGGDLYDDTKKLIVANAVNTYINKNYIDVKLDTELHEFKRWSDKKEFDLLYPDGTYKFNCHGSLGMLDFFYLEDAKSYITPADNARIRKNIIDKINKASAKLNNKYACVEYTNGFSHLCSMFNLSLSDFKYLSQAYASTYNRFNTLLRDWNKQQHFDVRQMTDLLRSSMQGPFK